MMTSSNQAGTRYPVHVKGTDSRPQRHRHHLQWSKAQILAKATELLHMCASADRPIHIQVDLTDVLKINLLEC